MRASLVRILVGLVACGSGCSPDDAARSPLGETRLSESQGADPQRSDPRRSAPQSERVLPPVALAGLRARSAALSSRHRVEAALASIDEELGRVLEPDGSRVLGGDEVELRRQQGSLLVSLSRPEEAIAVLEPLVARSGDARSRALLASALLDLRRHADALRTLEALDPATRRTRLVPLGRALVGSHRVEEGLAALVAALVQDPWDDTAALWLGRVLVREGRGAIARECLEAHARAEFSRRGDEEAKTFEYAGDEARALQRRARIERARGRLYEAMRLHQAALARNPGLVEAYLDLADLSLFLEHPDDAVLALARLPRRGPVLRALASALEATGDRDAATATLLEALAETPDDQEIAAELARLRGESASGASDPFATELHRARDSVRARVRGRAVSESVDGLLELVGAYSRADRAREARELALYLFRLAPGRSDVARAALAMHAGAEHRFLRLHVLLASRLPERSERLREELEPLGVTLEAMLGHLSS